MQYLHYLVTDMDDTMIEAYGKPTEEVKKLWNKISESPDIVTVIATGQQYTKVKSTFLANHLPLPTYIIADQGTVLYSTKINEILKTFWLPCDEVFPIVTEFLEKGGQPEFIRICTPEIIFAYDCKQARDFFNSTKQKNVIYGKDLLHVIKYGHYTKVILVNTPEMVDELVLFSANANTLMAVNTGETKYGDCHYHRFEVVSSNKKIGLEELLKISIDFPNNTIPVNILGLGDEHSDFGLAQATIGINLTPDNIGSFASIQNNTKGGLALAHDCESLSICIGYPDRLIKASSIKEDGWVKAVNAWLET